MSTYKITNITNQLGKRDFKYNSELEIEYIDNITKKIIKVLAGETVFLTVSSLPLSVHRLRIKNLITVSEISANELEKLINDSKPKVVKKNVDEEEKKTATRVANNKKKFTKKEEEPEIE
jgi:hypothetical protein